MTARWMVIVGAGLAGVSAAEELRRQGFDGTITMIGAESHPPYERPPLSKAVLLGEAEPSAAEVHPRSWFDDHDIELLSGVTATRLDPARRQLRAGDRTLGYDRLLLATGARPRRLPLGEDVCYLRTVEDSLRLRERLGGRVLVVGGGWIGLEVAAAARARGGEVTVVEAGELPLLGVLGPEVAGFFADLHRSHGVDLRVRTSLASLTGGRAELSDGASLDADAVVVGIGAEPDVRLAQEAGLGVDHGVLVDARLQTSDPRVFAAGDVASHDHPLLGRLRVEHWDNAIEQGRHAARSMLDEQAAYDRQPYFFSDQYDLGMEYVGHARADDPVTILGDLEAGKFRALWVRDGIVVAGMHANDWDAMAELRDAVGAPAR